LKTNTFEILVAATLLVLFFCVSCGNPYDYKEFEKAPPLGMFVATTDFTSGSAAIIKDAPSFSVSQPGVSLSSDPAARSYNGKVYVINRFGADNIQVLDPKENYKTIAQYSTGNESNPQDIAFVSESQAFISRLGEAKLLIVKPLSGKSLGSIDLSKYSDGDGLPEAAKMVIVDSRLFVALQRLDSTEFYAPTDMKGLIVVIDIISGTVLSTVELATKNPATDLIYDAASSKIFVGCSGGIKLYGYPENDGGIESISIDIGKDEYKADGVLFDEVALGGDVLGMAMVSNKQAYALVGDASFNNYLVRFNPSDPAEGITKIWQTSSWIAAIALDSEGFLYVADRDFTNPGVRIWDTSTDTQVTGSLIDVGLPPYNFALIQ